ALGSLKDSGLKLKKRKTIVNRTIFNRTVFNRTVFNRMRFRTFIVGLVLSLVVFLFAQRHRDIAAQPSQFRGVVDLTHVIDLSIRPGDWKNSSRMHPLAAASRNDALVEPLATQIEAPAQLARGMWTVDQIPAERLIASLVVL